MDPHLPYALTAKGFLLAEMDRHVDARAFLLQGLTLDPSSAVGWSSLAFAGWASGDNVGGAMAGRQAAKLDPNDTSPRFHIGMSLYQAGMLAEALQWFESCLDVDPDDMWALNSLVGVEWATGDRVAARAYVSRMREAGADNVFVMYYTGLAEAFDGNLEEAETALNQVVSASPYYANSGFPSAQALLGWVMVELGRPEGRERLESLRLLRVEQLEAGSSHTTAHLDLAVIASVLGDEEEQLRWFLEATRLDERGLLSLFGDTQMTDRIRDRPGFQSWVRESEKRRAAQRSELAATGPWTPEAVMVGGGG